VLVLQVQLLLAGDGIPYLQKIRIDMSGHFSKTCLENVAAPVKLKKLRFAQFDGQLICSIDLL
jgi:hypothetical protein